MKKLKKGMLSLIMGLCVLLAAPSILPEAANIQNVQAATKVKLNKSKATLIKGQTLQLKISGSSKKVSWSSSKKSVATVSSKGKVTAKKKGTAIITAKVDKKKYTCKITVETPKLNKSNATIKVKKNVTLKVTETKQKVKWSSKNKSIATVSSKGVVTGKKAGKTTIIAEVGGKKYNCKVTVKDAPLKTIAVTGITLNNRDRSFTLMEGDSTQFIAIVSPSNATNKDVTWSSSNSSVASVDHGNVVAKTIGTATITAQAGDKKVGRIICVVPKIEGSLDNCSTDTSYDASLGEHYANNPRSRFTLNLYNYSSKTLYLDSRSVSFAKKYRKTSLLGENKEYTSQHDVWVNDEMDINMKYIGYENGRVYYQLNQGYNTISFGSYLDDPFSIDGDYKVYFTIYLYGSNKTFQYVYDATTKLTTYVNPYNSVD